MVETHKDDVVNLIVKSVLEDEFSDELQHENFNESVEGFDLLKSLYDIYVKRPVNVLEVGCGSGRLICVLGVSHAVEPNPKRLKAAVEKASQCNAVVKQGFIEAFPFEDNMFDAVLAWDVLMFVRSEAEALVEVNRVLKTAGVFIFNVVEESYLPIAKPVNAHGFAKWVENFGFRVRALVPFRSHMGLKYAIVAEKVRAFDYRWLLLPQAKGEILNYVEERDWWLR